MRLEGKVTIVTGAGSIGPGMGNGKATAILFAREGAKVALTAGAQRVVLVQFVKNPRPKSGPK